MAVRTQARAGGRLPLLRIDGCGGGPGGQPVGDRASNASLPNVKLRLGRPMAGEEKGVDTLPALARVPLARGHAIAEADILGGDEEPWEGVLFAGPIGVRAALPGIPPCGARPDQAAKRVDGADAHTGLAEAFRGPSLLATEPSPDLAETGWPEHGAPAARAIGGRFGGELAPGHPVLIVSLRQGCPRLPADLDRRSLATAAPTRGPHMDDATRKAPRTACWDAAVGRSR
jgi:hypothetical protein